MHDTSAHIDEKVIEMIRKKSPYERVKMGCSMMKTSKQLMIRAILENDPEISEADLRQEFFLKFYGDDYTPAEQKKILEHLKNSSSSLKM